MLTLEPVEVVFSDVSVKIQTVITFAEGTGDIRFERKVLEMSDPDAEVTICEYMVGCYGTTEYSEDMTALTLAVVSGKETHSIHYEYKCRELSMQNADETVCVLPPVDTRVSMEAQGRDKCGFVKEGYAFSPMFTLGFTGTLKEKEVYTTWLRLRKAD